MSKNNTRAGSLLREDAGQIEFALSIFRDGQRLQTPDGQYNLDSFLRGFEIYESIATIKKIIKMLNGRPFWFKPA